MRTYHVTVGGRELTVRIGEDGGVLIEGSGDVHQVHRITATEFSVMIGTRQVRVVAAADGEGFDVIAGKFRGQVTVESERQRLLRKYARSTNGAGAKREVHAPMPAMVVRIAVAVGETVQAGQPLLVLEAMKMENEILSPAGGSVKEIHAIVGKPVEKGELLILFE